MRYGPTNNSGLSFSQSTLRNLGALSYSIAKCNSAIEVNYFSHLHTLYKDIYWCILFSKLWKFLCCVKYFSLIVIVLLSTLLLLNW